MNLYDYGYAIRMPSAPSDAPAQSYNALLNKTKARGKDLERKFSYIGLDSLFVPTFLCYLYLHGEVHYGFWIAYHNNNLLLCSSDIRPIENDIFYLKNFKRHIYQDIRYDLVSEDELNDIGWYKIYEY